MYVYPGSHIRVGQIRVGQIRVWSSLVGFLGDGLDVGFGPAAGTSGAHPHTKIGRKLKRSILNS